MDLRTWPITLLTSTRLSNGFTPNGDGLPQLSPLTPDERASRKVSVVANYLLSLSLTSKDSHLARRVYERVTWTHDRSLLHGSAA